VSLILDALNRSRQDDGPIPSLATEHYEDVVEDDWNPYQLLLVAALLFALAVIGWLLWDRDADPVEAVPAAPAAVEIRPAPALVTPVETTAVPAPASNPPPTVIPPSVAADPGVAALYRQQPSPESAAPEVAQPATDVAAKTVRQEQPVDIEALVAQAQDELADASLDEHEVPFIAKLSQQTKDSIPTILYQRHDYSGTAKQSSVLLNGKTLKVGGTAAAGLKVDEILPDSVVLNYKGTRFRLRALNSWVNL
jgi:general secretion pathway protein B